MKKLTLFVTTLLVAINGYSESIVGNSWSSTSNIATVATQASTPVLATEMSNSNSICDTYAASDHLLLAVTEPIVSNIHIKSLWEFSTKKGNKPEEKDIRNGFDYYNNELFLASRRGADTEVVIYDAKTGEPKIADGKIMQLSANSSLNMAWAGGDVAVDRNGAIYCVASNNANIIKWNSRDAATSSVFATLPNPATKPDAGFFGFDVYIDENGNGCIVGLSQITYKLCYIPITNNVAGAAKEMWLQDDVEPGTAPRTSIVDSKTFWIDGANIFPTLIELNDNLGIKSQRSFKPESINLGVSGITQFDYKDKTYLVVAANNHGTTHPSPKHSAAVFEFNPQDMSYKQIGDYLPSEGLGGTTDNSHMVAPVVHVADDAAYIYLMGGMDGIVAFKFYDSSEPVEPDFSYAKQVIRKYLGDAPFVNPIVSESDGTITYDSSSKNVATVDENGLVTIMEIGTTTITASVPATDTFLAATATYTLTVEAMPDGPIVETLWEYSVKKGNMTEVLDCRNGFDFYNGELFLASRRNADTEVVVYDAETGKVKMNNGKPVQLAASSDLSMAFAGGSVSIDSNGAIYVVASNSEKIIKWDSKDATTASVFTILPAKDIWALDVQIDKDGNGCIVSASQATGRVYYVPVTGNVAGEAVTLKVDSDLGYTPRTYIVDSKTFWVDGNANLPVRIILNDDLSIKSQQLLVANGISQGANGVVQFDFKDRTYLVVAANNHAPTNQIPNHSAKVFELNTTTLAAKEVIGYFPEEGLGAETDASHLVAPVVNVTDDAAYIYIMGGMNGIAAYKFTSYESGLTTPDFAYAVATITKTVTDEPFINPLTSNTDGVITYNSSKEDVATIDSDGKVTIHSNGTTVITATVAATEIYKAATATYILTVESGTDIDDSNNRPISVYATSDDIRVEFEGEANIEIYNISGILVDRTVAFESYSVTLANGLYFVKVNGKIYKVNK